MDAPGQLAGRGGLHHQPGPPARHEHPPPRILRGRRARTRPRGTRRAARPRDRPHRSRPPTHDPGRLARRQGLLLPRHPEDAQDARDHRRHPRAPRPAGQPQKTRQRGGRPPKFDPATYKNRNVVERSFSLLKQWRGLATRFDKLAIVYRSAAVLAARQPSAVSAKSGSRPGPPDARRGGHRCR
ncbi:transposase [Streptomyces formicae]|uniref:Transposase n=1 Tax=Streptomyces formicae TaxID=1616117 RepID=A0ABY3WUZ7_9ACTN|nr:transposase [Streptomyces formicae]